jgi:hypothetical protein
MARKSLSYTWRQLVRFDDRKDFRGNTAIF